MHEFAFVFAGFFVGLVVGLTGVGGGSLMTPLLIFVFGVKPHLAIGTDLLFAAFTKMGGTVSLARARVVDWRIVGQTALGSIPASLVTLYFLQRLGPADPQTQSIMTTTLGLALLLTAASTFYKVCRGKTPPQHIAPELLAQAGNECQRHRMGNIRRHDARQGQGGVKQHQHNHADGAGTH